MRGHMSKAAEHDFSHLPPAAGRLGATFARPKLVAMACVILLTALGWIYLALLIAGMGGELARLAPA